MPDRVISTPLNETFERYLQDKRKGRGGDGGNYRRNAARELQRFAEWAAGDHGHDDWTGVIPDDVDREPGFEDLDERVFREYARHLAGDRGFKQNTVQTYYRYISAWCGWCVKEGYLAAHYAQRASAMAPLPKDDGRKPGDQQAWTSEQRHALTRYVDKRACDAIKAYTTFSKEANPLDKQRARYTALKAARDLLLALEEGVRPPSITTDGARSILQRLSEDSEIDVDHPKHDYLAPHGGRHGMGKALVRAFGYTVAARYLDNSEEMVRECYSHIEAGELGNVATKALNKIDSIWERSNI